jgi:hypothetical protein
MPLMPTTMAMLSGKAYVEKFFRRFNRYPGNAGASAYTNLHEYLEPLPE